MSENIRLQHWIASQEDLLPDFIIGGAMKSGTTTLHQMLDKHPKIFIPENEIGFFDIDNILQHHDFNFFDEGKGEWTTQLMKEHPEKLWNWYKNKFKGKETYVKGEDSTTYLASSIAAERISIQKKPIKIIFLLRHPTHRAYSNYYHLLRTGRATYSFEDTIRFNPHCILNRSLYKEQLAHYYDLIPRERIKVILFEDLISNKVQVVKEVFDFLGLDFNELPANVLDMHSNKARLPKYISLQIKRNHFMRFFGNSHYLTSLPNTPDAKVVAPSIWVKIFNSLHSRINPKMVKKTPSIHPATKAFLDQYFLGELEGIDELVEQDLLSKWFGTYQTKSEGLSEDQLLKRSIIR